MTEGRGPLIELYRTAFDRAPVAVAIADLSDPEHRRIIDANTALCEMLGYDRASLLELGFDELTHPEDRAADVDGARRLGTDLEVFAREKRYLHADGSWIWGALYAVAITEADGRRLSVAQIVNIDRRVRAEHDRDRREQLLSLLGEVRLAMLAERPRAGIFELVCQSLVRVHDATFATIGVVADEGLRVVGYATPKGTAEPPARHISLSEHWAAAFTDAKAHVYRRSDIDPAADLHRWLEPSGEVLVAPLRSGSQAGGEVLPDHDGGLGEAVAGLVVVARAGGALPFDPVDHETLETVAHDVRLAIALSQARRTQRLLALAEERDRIGRSMNDDVIQRLFALGMRLQASLGDGATVEDRVRESVGEIDRVIAVIRETIFDLAGSTADVASRLMIVVETHDVADEVDVVVALNGEIDAVAAPIVDSLVTVLNESLTNVSRHASASNAAVEVTVDDAITITVSDDGTGFDPSSTRGYGLSSLEARAAESGGEFSVTSRPGGGTVVRWTVPRPAIATERDSVVGGAGPEADR